MDAHRPTSSSRRPSDASSGGNRRRSSFLIDDDMVAANALSFGGIASSNIVLKDSFNKNKKGPPPPPPPSKRSMPPKPRSGRRGGEALSSAAENKEDPPGSHTWGNDDDNEQDSHPSNGSNGNGQGSASAAKNKGGPPPPPPNHFRGDNDNANANANDNANDNEPPRRSSLEDAMGFMGSNNMSMIGKALQQDASCRSLMDDNRDSTKDLINGNGDVSDYSDDGDEEEEEEKFMEEDQPLISAQLSKRWAPKSKRQSMDEQDGDDNDAVKTKMTRKGSLLDSDNPQPIPDVMNDVMGFVSSGLQSGLQLNSESDTDGANKGITRKHSYRMSSDLGSSSDLNKSDKHYSRASSFSVREEEGTPRSSLENNGGERVTLRQSFKKSYSSPFHSSDLGGLERIEDDDSSTSTVKSDGRTKGRKNRTSMSNYDQLSAVEKLKLAQAKLEEEDDDEDEKKGEGGRNGSGKKFQKKDFINLLESSIRDIQAVQQQQQHQLQQHHRATIAQDEYSAEDNHHYGKMRSSLTKSTSGFSAADKSYSSNSRSRGTAGRHQGRSSPGEKSHARSSKSKGRESKSSRKSSRGSSSRHRRGSSRGRSTGGHSRKSRGDDRSTGHYSRASRDDSTHDGSTLGNRSGRRRSDRDRRKSSRRRSSENREKDWDGTVDSRSSRGRDFRRGESQASGATSSSSREFLASVPKEAREALARVRGSEALPREVVVSGVVRKLVSKIDREGDHRSINEDGEDEVHKPCCVAILSSSMPSNGNHEADGVGGAGMGKTTIAALTCVRGDIRTRYHRGIAWLDRGGRRRDSSDSLDFESYSKSLSDVCRQIGVKPQQLRLSPVVRTPGEDKVVSELRMRGHMRDAHGRMGRLLTSLQRKKSKHGNGGQHNSMLIVLDDVADPTDIEWFQFKRNGHADGEYVNDLLVTSRLAQIEGAAVLAVPPLETKEALRLLLTEGDLPSNHPAAGNPNAKNLVKQCKLHPLTIKFAGRWLSLKRVTSGGQKGIDEILKEVIAAVLEGKGKNGSDGNDSAGRLYSLINRAMSPNVKGKETKIVRLCFAALVSVFYCETRSASVPLEIANDFFLKVVENENDILSREDTFYQSNGRQASRLVPEILGALGVFNITKHTTTVEGSEKNESSIQIDHELVRNFSTLISHDEGMARLVTENARKRWNQAYVQSYFAQKAKYLWDDVQPDRSRRYALEKMPIHMIEAEMFDDVETLLRNESFIRGRFWSLGWTEGTRAHVNDAEAFCNRLLERQQPISAENNEDCFSVLVAVCKQLEAVLMEEVARESPGPIGRCTTLEAGRCLHEMSVSLAKFRLWNEASRFCDSCAELVESNLGASELVASLLYNSSVMHTEANESDEAERKIGDCLDMRVKTCGTENILYVRALCQLGDILSLSSDYSAAESCFNKSIGILKVMPARYHLDFGVTLYKLGRNQHRRGGYLDEALHCYEEALEFEKDELGPDHIYLASILMHTGDICLDKEDEQQAKHTFREALDVLSEAADNAATVSSSSFDLQIKVAITEGKLFSIANQSDECVEQYQRALTLLQRHAPAKKYKIAHLNALIGTQHEMMGNYSASEKFYEESVLTMKSAFGPFHLDISETLVNLSGVKSALGEGTGNSDKNAQATECLKEAIDIQKSRLGDCEEVVITLTILGAHLKAIGSYTMAELVYNDAMRISQSLEGDQDLTLADAYLGIADLMTAMEKYDDAMENFALCLEIQESVFGEKHEDIASTLYAMGLTKHTEGSNSKALVFFAKCLVMQVELHGDVHPSVGDAYDMMGFIEAQNGNLDTSLRRLNDAVKVRRSVGDKLKEADSLNNLGSLYREKNEFEMALECYDQCMNLRIEELGKNNESVAEVFMAMGNVQSDMENPQEALEHYREALQILMSVKGPTDPSVASTLQKVGMVQFRAGNLESGRKMLEQAVEVYRQGGKAEEYEPQLVTPLFVIGNINNFLQQEEEARKVWNDAFEINKRSGKKSNPDVHNALLQLLDVH